MSICTSPQNSIRLRAGPRRTAAWAVQRRAPYGRAELVCRRASMPIPQKVVHNTVRQTVLHLHQTTLQHLHRPPRQVGRLDPAQPARAARALLRIFSKESAKRELRPFYRDVVRSALEEEQQRYRGHPTRTAALLWTLLGRHCIRQLWSQDVWSLPVRYTVHPAAVEGDLLRLPAARRAAPPSREALERMARAIPREDAPPARPSPPPAGQGPGLSGAEFQALVRDVGDSLRRQARLEALQRGGA